MAKADMWELIKQCETTSPEVIEARQKLPPDVQAVIADFEKDYETALNNFKESLVAAFTWAQHARDQLILLSSYLRAEQMADYAGIKRDNEAEEVKRGKS